MVGSFFKEATVLILFCHIFVNAEDLLEIYRPNPSLPQELNEWLSQVQEHKGDFRLIQDSVGEQPKNLIHFSEDYDGEESKNEDIDDLSVRDDYKNRKSGPFDDRPHNDIYPNMFRSLKDNNFPPSRKTYLQREPLSSKYAKSPIRLRRSSNHVPFFEHESPVNVVPVGKVGELKRSENKYPDSYSRNGDDVVGKSGRSVKLNDLKKREIQIDIKNDGRLVKKIYEDTKNPKSIVLNIQSPEISKDPLENPKDLESNLNFEKGYKNFQQNPQDLTSKTKNAPGLNIRSDYNRMKNKELINNFNNLFSANEHLNTDNSLAHETSTESHSIHYVATPQATSAPKFNVQQYHGYDTIGRANASIFNNKFSRQNSFNGNNMQDMSGFWTNFEKNQLQKGLDRARVNKNYMAQKVKASVKDHDAGKIKESASGFEPAQTIELDDAGDSSGKIEDTYRMDNSRSACDGSCIRVNGMTNPNCAACMNRMNNFNSWSNLNDGKDANLTNAMNSLNDMKLISELSTTDNLLNANGMGGLNGLNYNLGVNRQESNKLAGENSFSNSLGTSRGENKRQLEVPEESLQLIDNDNFKNEVVSFTNLTGNDNVDAYNHQYVTEAKRNDEIFQTNLLEKDITTTSLSGALAHSVNTVDLDKPPKTVDEINLESDIESPLNNNENMMNSEHDDNFNLNEKEIRVVHNEMPILIGKTSIGNNEGSFSGDTGPVVAIEHDIPDNTVGKVQQNFEELPLPIEHVAVPEQLRNDKHEKTIVHKISKALKNDKKVTKIETITETDDADTEENEEEMDIDYCNGLEEDNDELHEIEGVVPSSRLEKEHREEETAMEASLEPQKSHGRGHVNEEVEDLDSSDAPHAGIHQELHYPHHEKQNDDEEETIIDIKHHQKAVHMPTSQEHCHNIEEDVSHTGNGFRGNSYNRHVQNRRKTYHSPEKNKHNKKKKHFERKKPKHYHNYINDIPAELIIKKRGDRNEIHSRKRYRKRYHRDGQFVNDFDSQEYGNLIDEDTSTDSKDLIPAFIGRQLKAVDYVYDAYLHRPGVNFDEELSTELQEISSKKTNVVHASTARQRAPPRKNHHVGLLHKNSAEGDYGEEEDSVTETPRKDNNVMIKKTKNEFANPETTTESEDYDNYENYDNSVTTKKEKLKPKHELRKQKKKGGKNGRLRRKQPTELKGHDVKNFAHHRQKYKPKGRKNKNPRSALEAQYYKEHEDDLPSKFWSPVYHSDANKFSKLKLENTNSDFQHWPSFVMDDRQNEEMLRKRSPITKKKYPRAFSFPVSMKDFFVKPQKKAGTSEVKREKPNSLLLDENLANENKQPQDEIDRALSAEKGLNAPEKTMSDDEVTAICTERVPITNVCEDKENFNKTSVQLTTILSMTVETSSDLQDECNNNTDIEETNSTSQERLDDILNGKLPFQLVSEILETLSKNSKLKDRFNKGLKKSGPDKNFLKSLNETNIEAKKLVQSMTNIVNKLQYTATCQSLPSSLRHYIKIVTRGIKSDPLAKTREMEEIEFDENQNQDSFVFQSSSQSDSFEGKVKIFQDLLDRFNKLPEKCKVRAMPVKEYIENHLGMLNNMLNINANSNAEKNTKPKKSIEHVQDESVKSEDELIQEQLESLGLGKQKRFKPKFDLDQMVEESKLHKSSTNGQSRATERPRGANVNKRDLKSVSRSKKYNKLVDAVRSLRLRREGEKRLAEMYGNRGVDDYGGIHFNLRSEGDEDMSKANFESPLVYSF